MEQPEKRKWPVWFMGLRHIRPGITMYKKLTVKISFLLTVVFLSCYLVHTYYTIKSSTRQLLPSPALLSHGRQHPQISQLLEDCSQPGLYPAAVRTLLATRSPLLPPHTHQLTNTISLQPKSGIGSGSLSAHHHKKSRASRSLLISHQLGSAHPLADQFPHSCLSPDSAILLTGTLSSSRSLYLGRSHNFLVLTGIILRMKED